MSRTWRWNVGTHGGLQSNATCKILHTVEPRPTVWLRWRQLRVQQSFWAFYYFYHLLWLRALALFSLERHLLPLLWLEVKHWLQTWSGGGVKSSSSMFPSPRRRHQTRPWVHLAKLISSAHKLCLEAVWDLDMRRCSFGPAISQKTWS